MVSRNVSSTDAGGMNKWINIRPVGAMNETTGDKLKEATARLSCCSTEEIMTKHFLLDFITS